jgi:hypothetical protein
VAVPRVYTVSMDDVTVIASGILVQIHADSTWGSAGSLLEILRCGISQRATATSEMIGVILGEKADVEATVTAATPEPHVLNGTASGITGATDGAEGTAGVDASANGAGTFTTIIADSFNNLNGFLWVPTPEERIIVGPDQCFALSLDTTPTSLDNWTAYVTYAEIE